MDRLAWLWDSSLEIQQTSVNPHLFYPDLHQNWWYEWLLTFWFKKIFSLSRFFNPDLCQFWTKSAIFTSHHLDFSVLPRCCVLKCTDWSLWKIQQLSDAWVYCTQQDVKAKETKSSSWQNTLRKDKNLTIHWWTTYNEKEKHCCGFWYSAADF